MQTKIVTRLQLFFIAMIVLPLAVMSQSKNVISVHRVFPKVDKVAEFEKALTAHAQKYHTGDVSWRVYAVQSGPDYGAYHITEGPKTWDSEDTRGDINPEHMADWNKNVAIYLTDRESAGYYVYQDSLSTVALGEFSDKMNVTHIYPKMGASDNVVAMLKKLKKTWTAAGVTVAVYSASSSGKTQFTVVTRYKQGLKERNANFRKPFRETHEAANGEGAYAQYLEDAAEYLNDSWSELLFYRKDLSSR